MNIGRLYVIFTTWNMRLPYWFIATVIVVYVVLCIILLVMWKKKVWYNGLYNIANKKLNKSNNEIFDITSKYNAKEEEIVKLNKVIAISEKNHQKQDNFIKNLNSKIARQETAITENINKLQVCQSEKKNLLSKLKAKDKDIKILNNSLALAKEGIQKIEKEREHFKRLMKDTQEVLNQKINQFEILEIKCKQVESQNQTLVSSNILLEKDINELKAILVKQEKAYKCEIRNLNLEIGRRNEKVERLNESLDEMKKILQVVQDEKTLIENELQEMQKISKEHATHTEHCKNLIEKIAKW